LHKGRVLSGHEYVPNDPELASNARISDNTADTVAGTRRDGPKVEGGGEWEVLSGKCKGDVRKSRGAWECVESLADRSVFFGSRDFGVESLDVGSVADNESGSLSKKRQINVTYMIMNAHRVDDASRGVDGLLAGDVKSIKLDLPVAFLGHWNIGKLASKQVVIESTDGELRVVGREFHSEDGVAGLSFGDEALEDGRSIILAYALETHAHETICREVGA
jgi:hypothetical protein